MKRIDNPVLIFDNLNIAVFVAGCQEVELQKSVPELLAEYMERCGYDPEGVVIQTQQGRSFKIFRTTDGAWNHRQIV